MRHLILMLLTTLLAWAQPPAKVIALGEEYQELRKQKGHFTGGGEWNEAVDHWKGRKHEVMAELGLLLNHGKTSELLAIMGEPDARQDDQWVYYWRGRHDYLFFKVKGSQIVHSDWWMAGE